MNCIKCQKEFTPTKNNIKKKHYICPECRRKYDKEWRIKRKSLGLPCRGKSSKEWRDQYYKEYYKRPEVKKRVAKWASEYRKKESEQIKIRCRYIVRNAIRNKILFKKSCEKCGNAKSEAHHKDYYKPLEVTWLCSKCHKQEHQPKER